MDYKTAFTFTYFPRTSMLFQLLFPFKHPLKIYIHSLALPVSEKKKKIKEQVHIVTLTSLYVAFRHVFI